MKYRVTLASSAGMSEGEALKALHKSDEDRIAWTRSILEKDDPRDASTYDMVIPTDKMTPEEIADLVKKNLEADILKTSAQMRKPFRIFFLHPRLRPH